METNKMFKDYSSGHKTCETNKMILNHSRRHKIIEINILEKYF